MKDFDLAKSKFTDMAPTKMKKSRNAKRRQTGPSFLVKLEDWAPTKMKKIFTRHQGRQTSLPYSAG